MRRPALAAALVAAGAAVGTALVRRRRAARPPVEPDPLPRPQGRERTVVAEDGVALHVVEHGPADATTTLVLAHGYVQSSVLWGGQVADLLAHRPDLRVVVYDHRGHGRSGATARGSATLEQLARDLVRVLDEVAPDGPVVLGGHSMGGMTVMALAEQRPELFGDRVTGVALVATSAGGLADVTYGLPRPVARAAQRLVPVANELAVRRERSGRARTVTGFEARLVFGRGAHADHVREVLEVQRACSAETVASFLATFSAHDRLQALSALAEVPAVVVVGEDDRLTPVAHSRALAGALPRAELVLYPGVGHMVQVERRAEVSRVLGELVDRARAAAPAAVLA